MKEQHEKSKGRSHFIDVLSKICFIGWWFTIAQLTYKQAGALIFGCQLKIIKWSLGRSGHVNYCSVMALCSIKHLAVKKEKYSLQLLIH